MKKRRYAISAECLTFNVPASLRAAIAKGAEQRMTTLSAYLCDAALQALQRDGVEVAMRSGNRGQPLPTVVP
jgi:hypothetical protein